MSDEEAERPAGVDPDLLARARESAAGHPGLEEALSRIGALDDLDLEHHPAEFDAIHRALRAALSDGRPDAPDGP